MAPTTAATTTAAPATTTTATTTPKAARSRRASASVPTTAPTTPPALAAPTTPPATTKKAARTKRDTPPVVAPPAPVQVLDATCDRDALKHGLGLVGHAVAAKSTLPVLSHVLIAADGPARLRLTATDLQHGITTHIPATVVGDGAITVPAKLLTDLVATLPNDAVTLMLDDGTQTLQLRCGRSEASVKGITAEDFPTLPTSATADPALTLPAAVLREAIGQVAFAAATDENRPALTGVLCDLRDATLRLSASDGFRLAIKTVALADAVAPRTLIIPARALVDLQRLLPASDAPVTLAVTPNGGQVVISCGDSEVMSRLIDGQFPDLQRVIPQRYTTRAVVDRPALQRAVKQAAVFAASKITRLTLDGAAADGAGRLTIAATTAEVGANQSTLTVHIAGADGRIAFNNTFLQEALQAIPTAELAIEVQTDRTPGVLRPIGDESLLVILMPLLIA
jgi:DNA polymerase-3 subunit beta